MLGRLGRLSQLPRRRRLQLLLLLLSILLCATLLVEDVTWRLRSASMLVWGRYHEKFCPSPELNITTTEKVVLFWTPFFGDMQFKVGYGRQPFQDCPVSNCVATNQRRYLQSASAIFFHPIEFSDFDLPEWRSPDQLWVFFLLESPEYMGARFTEATKSIFNATFTYRRDSDFYRPYFLMEPVPEDQRATTPPPTSSAERWLDRLPWVVSHCSTKGKREEYVAELTKHLPVDVYGRCGTLQCSELPGIFSSGMVNPHTCYRRLHQQYQFYLSFENSRCRDYITEKFFVALQHNLVPIVYGARREDYEAIAPPNSFIHADDFTGPEELATYVRYLMNNSSALGRYTEWQGKWRPRGPDPEPWCRLCERLNSGSALRSNYPDINTWWRGPDDKGQVCV